MYQTKQSVKTSVSVLSIILSLVFAFTLIAGNGNGNGHWNHGLSVEEIYDSIRYSTPESGVQFDESIVTFQNEGMTLVCTLTVPNISKKPPIVITLNGFGGVRDEEPIPGTNETVFSRTSRVLAEQGIASLRVDFRGQGESDGDYSITSFSGQISDVNAALDYIEGNLYNRIDVKSIGIIGFSQGGLVGAITASNDKRIDTLVLWSAPSNPAHDYEGLITKEGIKNGLALSESESITLPLYFEGQIFAEMTLRKQFFTDLFKFHPLGDLYHYKKPLMYVAGSADPIVWPQPHIGETFLKYHKGFNKLVIIDGGDHEFNYWEGGEATKLTDAIYWSTAWFIKTLK